MQVRGSILRLRRQPLPAVMSINNVVATAAATVLLTAAIALAFTRSSGLDSPNQWRNATKRTVGSVIPWPKKLVRTNGDDHLAIKPDRFKVNLGEAVKGCDIVERAVHRYTISSLFFDDERPESKDQDSTGMSIGKLKSLELQSIGPDFGCESLPHADMIEEYSLEIVAGDQDDPADPSRAVLKARTSWGIIRGLETFSQLVFNTSPNNYAIVPAFIEDGPRFKYRGFMLDTARHYVPLDKIMDLLDAMAYNKLNVFHWHLVDDQSFPFQSAVYPQLSKKASFRPHMIYKSQDIKYIIRYAADRGIRVMPELDTPGHTYSMRYIEGLLAECYNPETKELNGDLGPINPTKESSFKVVTKILNEIGRLFPESYFHAGGDEVDFDCWKSNPNITRWMEDNGMSGDYRKLSTYYIRRIYDILRSGKKSTLVWQEMFDDGADLPKDAIIHVWKDINNRSKFMAELKRVVDQGYRAILSSCWYLNYIDYAQDWIKFYKCDPTEKPIDRNTSHLVLGGEICMWTEYVDENNVVSRTWPRASAAAERLWSSLEKPDVDEFLHRLEQHRCRLVYRGIQAEPVNGPGYC